jgi:hypothetical protein
MPQAARKRDAFSCWAAPVKKRRDTAERGAPELCPNSTSKSRARTVPAPPSAQFLPNYDEYGIAYQDRDLVGSARRMVEPGAPSHDDFAHLLLINGQLAGRWRRAVKNDSVLVRVFPYNRPTRIEQRTLATAAERYSTFMNLRVKMSIG